MKKRGNITKSTSPCHSLFIKLLHTLQIKHSNQTFKQQFFKLLIFSFWWFYLSHSTITFWVFPWFSICLLSLHTVYLICNSDFIHSLNISKPPQYFSFIAVNHCCILNTFIQKLCILDLLFCFTTHNRHT